LTFEYFSGILRLDSLENARERRETDTMNMQAKLILSSPSGHPTIHIKAHHATFAKWWAEICQNGLTTSASKYVNEPRKAFGVYIIDAEPDLKDAILSIWHLGGLCNLPKIERISTLIRGLQTNGYSCVEIEDDFESFSHPENPNVFIRVYKDGRIMWDKDGEETPISPTLRNFILNSR